MTSKGQIQQVQPVAQAKTNAPAASALRPEVNAAAVMASYYAAPLGTNGADIDPFLAPLIQSTREMQAGDMRSAEAMLLNQAYALQAIFMNLARRAQAQEYLKHWEAYLRMALKAQNQSRMTLETLATVKNPPVFAKQANINNGGQQQVNNGIGGARTQGAETVPNELLRRVGSGQSLEPGTSSPTGCLDTQLATVGAIHRAQNGGGESAFFPQPVQGRAAEQIESLGAVAERGFAGPAGDLATDGPVTSIPIPSATASDSRSRALRRKQGGTTA